MGGLVVFSVTADLFLFIVRAFSLFLNICYFGPITVFITCVFLVLCADGVLLLPNGVLSAEGVLSLPNGMLNPKISLQSSASSTMPVVIISIITMAIIVVIIIVVIIIISSTADSAAAASVHTYMSIWTLYHIAHDSPLVDWMKIDLEMSLRKLDTPHWKVEENLFH